MGKRILPAFLLFIAFFQIVNAQQKLSCGFDAMHQRQMKINPAYQKAVLQFEQFARTYKPVANAGAREQASVIMPVVVHIVHTGGALGSNYNPTDQQIQNVIAYLNQVYAGTYYNEGVGDLGVQFALAQRDPNCNPTNGINHINGSGLSGYTVNGVSSGTGGSGVDEVMLKNFIRWDPTRYCNVWVVNKIDGLDGFNNSGGTGGFAYFPFTASIDGVVIRAYDMQVGFSTLPHEMGHTFTLYHPFEGSTGPTGNVCPPNGDPGDRVDDTDPVTNPNFFYPERTGNNPCTVPVKAYTSATERNIMSYVYTPTLFTAGQKTRLLAGAADPNRVSQENSLGNIAPSQGATTCPPKIDFELTEYQMTEVTAGSVTAGGCTRNYKDYSFNLLIGNSPSAAATATLTVGGTAQEGVDFDITTNGNFSSPSKSISFPTGSTAVKTFTVRIYDDANVESTETITLGFTVNNGGGNAVAGDGRTILTLSIFDNDTAPYGALNTSYALDNSYHYQAPVPFAGSADQFKCQLLYKANELIAAGLTAGNLVGLSVNITKATAANFKYKTFTIKLKQSNKTYLENYTAGTVAPEADAGFTTVYSADYSTVNGLNTFNFSTPFTWDGVSGIAVNICFDNGGVTDPADDQVNFYSDDYSADNACLLFQYTNCATAFFSSPGYYNNDYKPAINFIRHDPGTTVQTVLNSSKQEYLGPNADVYFYDQTNGALLARVKNLSSFNYGCTQVVIDRAGTGASQFWNNNTANYLMNKTFRIIPATNNASGQYEATFYYTSDEVNGWQTATGQSFNNIQLVKVGGQISSVTPANPNAAGTPLVVTPSRAGLGTNYSLMYAFNTGFSGFGAGLVGFALPVRLADFSGVVQNNHAMLSWQTTEEINSSLFEIERSYDGLSFSKIGSVVAAGNTSTGKTYGFVDKEVMQQVNYYRLKMIDKDGQFAYSKTILLKPVSTGSFSIISNPVHNSLDMLFGNINSGPAAVRIMDITGRVLQSWSGAISTGQRLSIPLNVFITQGVYTVQVVRGNSQFVGKIIKQ